VGLSRKGKHIEREVRESILEGREVRDSKKRGVSGREGDGHFASAYIFLLEVQLRGAS